MNLTDIQIKAWIKNNERFEGKADTGTNIRGLYISYRKDFSTPQWRFRFKIEGKSQQFFFGHYPEITLKVARKKAEEFRAQVRLGINPAEEKRKSKAKSVAEINKRKNRITVVQFADKYYENRVKNQLKEPKHALGHINRIKDNLGNMSIEEVSSRHITDMYTKDLKRGYPSSTNKMREQTKKMFKHAVVSGVIQFSPAEAHDISYAGGGQESRDRNLSKDELISLFFEMREAKGFGRENYLTIKLLLLLCVRKSELIKAKKSEFDLNDSTWLLVKEPSKSTGKHNKGRTICIPLPTQAVVTLRELYKLALARSMESEYLLPSRRKKEGVLLHISENTLNVALEKIESIPHFVVHDLRRTAKTKMQEHGVEELVSEMCLNHQLSGVQRTYGRHDFFEERKGALQDWADYLTECENKSFELNVKEA